MNAAPVKVLDTRARPGAMLLRACASFGVALPSFWLGIMLILVFSVQFGLLPSSGRGTLEHLVLPALTLGLFTTARITRERAREAGWVQAIEAAGGQVVADTCAGFVELAKCDKAVGRTVNIGSGREISVGDLAELLIVSELAFGGAEPVVSKAAGEKCPRCWNWRSDGGAFAAVPAACGRCADVLAGLGVEIDEEKLAQGRRSAFKGSRFHRGNQIPH